MTLSRMLFPVLLASLTALAAPALAASAPVPVEPVPYGKSPINVTTPPGFTDVTASASHLMQEVKDSVDGTVLKVYLPYVMAQRMAEGRGDGVTRMACLYGPKDAARYTLDKRGLDLMGKTLEGAYATFQRVPEDIRKDRAALEEFLQTAVKERRSVLVETGSMGETTWFIALIAYPMDKEAAVSSALCTTLVLVNDTVLQVSSSSIISGPDPADDLAWVKSTADTFTGMLTSANKK